MTERGCCDRHGKLDLPCESDERCDTYFNYFVRRLGSTVSVRNETCTQSTQSATGSQASSGSLHQRTSQTNDNDGVIDFSSPTVLGLSNPLILRGLDNEWQVRVFYCWCIFQP